MSMLSTVNSKLFTLMKGTNCMKTI
jgi:hypothetical protein